MSIRKVQVRPRTTPEAGCAPLFQAGLRIDLSCRDPDEMSERAAYWDLEQWQLGRGPFLGRFRAIHSGHLQLGCNFRDPGLIIRGVSPRETVALGSVSPSAPVLYNGSGVCDDRVMFAGVGREIDIRVRGAGEMITMAVHAPTFEAHARACLGASFFDGRPSDRLALPDAGCRARLNRRLIDLLEEGLATPERLGEAASAQDWEQRVLDAWLADVVAPDPGLPPPSRHRAARRAEAFLRAHLGRAVSIGELCRECGVPRRTLMLGFRDAFGASPAAYHRTLRLNEARRELVHSSATEQSVTGVALRWGFDHLGRFSADYRRLFGEAPSRTLRG